MLSAKQASELYGRTIRTVRRWQAALGRNGVKRVGGLVLINRKALMRYILYGR